MKKRSNFFSLIKWKWKLVLAKLFLFVCILIIYQRNKSFHQMLNNKTKYDISTFDDMKESITTSSNNDEKKEEKKKKPKMGVCITGQFSRLIGLQNKLQYFLLPSLKEYDITLAMVLSSTTSYTNTIRQTIDIKNQSESQNVWTKDKILKYLQPYSKRIANSSQYDINKKIADNYHNMDTSTNQVYFDDIIINNFQYHPKWKATRRYHDAIVANSRIGKVTDPEKRVQNHVKQYQNLYQCWNIFKKTQKAYDLFVRFRDDGVFFKEFVPTDKMLSINAPNNNNNNNNNNDLHHYIQKKEYADGYTIDCNNWDEGINDKFMMVKGMKAGKIYFTEGLAAITDFRYYRDVSNLHCHPGEKKQGWCLAPESFLNAYLKYHGLLLHALSVDQILYTNASPRPKEEAYEEEEKEEEENVDDGEEAYDKEEEEEEEDNLTLNTMEHDQYCFVDIQQIIGQQKERFKNCASDNDIKWISALYHQDNNPLQCDGLIKLKKRKIKIKRSSLES